MSSRQPVCEDAAAITARVRELRAERLAAIAGCACPPDGAGGQTHRPGCALEPQPMPPSQMSLALEAMQRARARLRQAGVPIREIKPERADEIVGEGIAAKYARHRVLS